jgi:hypothetical protein
MLGHEKYYLVQNPSPLPHTKHLTQNYRLVNLTEKASYQTPFKNG